MRKLSPRENELPKVTELVHEWQRQNSSFSASWSRSLPHCLLCAQWHWRTGHREIWGECSVVGILFCICLLRLSIFICSLKLSLGLLTHSYSPSYLGGRGKRIPWGQGRPHGKTLSQKFFKKLTELRVARDLGRISNLASASMCNLLKPFKVHV